MVLSRRVGPVWNCENKMGMDLKTVEERGGIWGWGGGERMKSEDLGGVGRDKS